MNALQIKVDSKLPIINGNFDEIQKKLSSELSKYDVIIDIDSEESVKEAKATATNINKLKGQIDTLRKEEVAKLSGPISSFTANMNALKELCVESRQKILDQVRVVDEKKIVKLKTLLNQELEATYIKYGVEAEYQIVKIDDLAIVSNLNKTGIAKKARDAIDERVLETKKFQEKIGTRLMTLETICFKGGLQVPLRRKNIESFLFVESDDVYLEELVSLIENEVSRIREMEVRKEDIQAKQEKVAETKVNYHTPIQTQQSNTKESVLQRFKNAKEFLPQKKKYVVTATFEVEVNENIGDKLEAMMLQKFRSGGFKTTPKITVLSMQQ